jgi:DNA polymerase delta subunit 2
LGTSGQSIDDIKRYSSKDSTLEIMEDTLKWAHLCPTAPDTLDCYPFYENDPFILKNSPHVYFVGNQEKFETKLVSIPSTKSFVRLVSIPKFSKTFELILLNLKTFDCTSIKFD